MKRASKLVERKLQGHSIRSILDEIETDVPTLCELARDLERDLQAAGVSGYSLHWGEDVQKHVICEADRTFLSLVYRVLDTYQDIYPEVDFVASWRDQ